MTKEKRDRFDQMLLALRNVIALVSPERRDLARATLDPVTVYLEEESGAQAEKTPENKKHKDK